MNKTIAVLENHGLVDPDRVLDMIATVSRGKWNALSSELKESLDESLDVVQAEHDLTPFNFVASASLRGLGGCSSPKCRLKKTRMISRYAALFCDRVVLPVHLHPFDENEPIESVQDAFETTVLSLLELRPLIEANIINLVPELDFCPECQPNKFPSSAIIIKAAETLKARNYSQFALIKTTDRSLKFTGPEDYIEHGEIYKRHPPFDLDSLPDGPLPDEYLKQSRYVDRVFSRIVKDVVLQQVYGVRFNAKYLTDLPGEAEVLSALNENDQLAARTAALCARLSHRVPLMGEIPLEHIVKIRREDHTVFLNYRIALQKIIRDYLSGKQIVGDSEAKELFADILEPAIRKMEVHAKTERNAILKKSGAKLAATFAAIALGVHSGIVPDQLASIIASMGGFAALGNIAEALASLNASTVRNDNLFFLLRLKQEYND
jgi:hypothetical protein